jgi:hypothetical protein
MQRVVEWIENWWMHLDGGDKGTWVGGVFTALTLIATLAISAISLIISAITALRQRSKSLKLREAEQDTVRRSHAERFSCWVAGRINSPATGLQVHPGDLVVTLVNASEQPFIEAVVEVGLKDDQGTASMRWFKISVVTPGTTSISDNHSTKLVKALPSTGSGKTPNWSPNVGAGRLSAPRSTTTSPPPVSVTGPDSRRS